MNDKPAISIVIPVWNVEKYLKECLDSIAVQTFSNFEAICIDDGSPDNCGKILDDYALKDNRFKVIHQENGGEAVARNRGIEAAQGEYLYFVDDDDYLHPQTLEVFYKIIISSGFDGVVCKHSEVHERYQPMAADIDIDKVQYQIVEQPLQAFLDDKKLITIAPWCKLYKRSVVGDMRFIKGIHFDDVPFNIFMLDKVDKVAVIEEKLYFFYQNQKSVSHTNINEKKVRNYITIVRSIYDYMLAQNKPQMLRELQKKCLPTYINVPMGAVAKMQKSNPEMAKNLRAILQEDVRKLLDEKIIYYKDFKWRKRLAIFKLVNF